MSIDRSISKNEPFLADNHSTELQDIIKNEIWLTGSNGNIIFPMLAKTGFTLIPTGKLLSRHIAPLCGELISRHGIGILGNNMTALSGVNGEEKSHFDSAWGYASMKFKQASMAGLENRVITALTNMIQFAKGALAKHTVELDEYDFLRIVLFLLFTLQLQELNNKTYQEKFQKECSAIASSILEKGGQFWECLIGSIAYDPVRESELRSNVQRIMGALNSIEASVKFTAEDREEIDTLLNESKGVFPVVFVTESKLFDRRQYSGSGLVSGEVLYYGELRLGEEVRLIITDNVHLEFVQKFVTSRKLNVLVCTYDQFLKYKYNIESSHTKVAVNDGLSSSASKNSVAFFSSQGLPIGGSAVSAAEQKVSQIGASLSSL